MRSQWPGIGAARSAGREHSRRLVPCSPFCKFSVRAPSNAPGPAPPAGYFVFRLSRSAFLLSPLGSYQGHRGDRFYSSANALANGEKLFEKGLGVGECRRCEDGDGHLQNGNMRIGRGEKMRSAQKRNSLPIKKM